MRSSAVRRCSTGGSKRSARPTPGCARWQQQGAYRIMQLTTVVHNETGQRPGKAEKAAFKLWTEQYNIGAGVVHPGREANAVAAVAMLHDCLALIQELVATVVDQAPEWVALSAVTSPTPEQIQKVNSLHNPAAAPYLFTRFTGWAWLEKPDSVRLLPEEGRWPARPYIERLADESPARLVKWLNKDKHLEMIWRSGRGATAELVLLRWHLGGHGAHLLTRSALAPWHDIEARAHARILLLAADAQPAPEHPAATEQLRRALVEAGEVDLARTTSTNS
ncbi:hypothetical protein AB0C61_29165 [Streptomyces sp. NPDC048680]|uniref:hypothetical protein n=1 Tax=Streptomyces sp. NPDC048680 TaxID=3155492 RepID=UPI00342A32CA